MKWHVYADSGLYMGDVAADCESDALTRAVQSHPGVKLRVIKETVQERWVKQPDSDVDIQLDPKP